MRDNLVIVESPAKAKTIEKFLGSEFHVTSSFGHIRDLEKKNLGFDVENNFKPNYIVSDDKKKVVSELKKLAKEAKTIWLASDEDREGEAIAWHLFEELKLKEDSTRRIVFNEITKEAILKAIKNPRSIDINLVNAQQARRVLDRMVGFELSPILWRKVKPSLSAGRVQSVAVRLLVEREREVMQFTSTSAFKVDGLFTHRSKEGKESKFAASLPEKLKDASLAKAFLEKCKSASYAIEDIVTKPSKKSPSAPFTTSTLQQEASRKLGFSVGQTMAVAQKLYEAGKITYMRTDSVNLSETALEGAKNAIISQFGEKYLFTRQYKTKSKGAQEAHEAIRPTYMDKETVAGTNNEKRLYELIWKRTIASQMSDAQLEKTTATIGISNTSEKFIATGEVLKFEGFLKVYIESTDDEPEEENSTLLPALQKGDIPGLVSITATQRFTHHPPRYTEASLVKKLEELGIGRPSTYAPIISTIQQRGYVVKEDRPGTEREYKVITLASGQVKEQVKKEITGAEKAKLFPNDIGMVVNDFLVKHFSDIMEYHFTASVEKEFDEIAAGKASWTKMIGDFYKPFHVKVAETTKNTERDTGERVLGVDPESGKPVVVKIGRYGPMAQIGESNEEEKPRFAGLLKGQHIGTITLEEALGLFKFPRTIGEFEGKTVVAGIGRFGPFIRHDSKFVSLKPDVDNPVTIEIDRAIELILEKREKDQNKYIQTFDEEPGLSVLNGRWGPYITYKSNNYKIPKDTDPTKLSLKDCLDLIKTQDAKGKTGKKTGRKKK